MRAGEHKHRVPLGVSGFDMFRLSWTTCSTKGWVHIWSWERVQRHAPVHAAAKVVSGSCRSHSNVRGCCVQHLGHTCISICQVSIRGLQQRCCYAMSPCSPTGLRIECVLALMPSWPGHGQTPMLALLTMRDLLSGRLMWLLG